MHDCHCWTALCSLWQSHTHQWCAAMCTHADPQVRKGAWLKGLCRHRLQILKTIWLEHSAYAFTAREVFITVLRHPPILLMALSDHLPFNQYRLRERSPVPEDILLSIVDHEVEHFPQQRSTGSVPSRGLWTIPDIHQSRQQGLIRQRFGSKRRWRSVSAVSRKQATDVSGC